MSEEEKRPRRSKNIKSKSVNDIAACLNAKNVEDYIYNIITDPQHPTYCDVGCLRDYLNTSSVTLRDIRGDNGETILFNAALISDEEKALEMMRFFIEEQGLIAESEDDLNQTVLYYAAREGKTKCIDYLVENGCNVHHIDQYGQTPLYYAVRENRVETAKKLISMLGEGDERIRKLNHVDNEGESCLFYACHEGHYEMIVLLVECGINFNIENKSKDTCLDIVKRGKHSKAEFGKCGKFKSKFSKILKI